MKKKQISPLKKKKQTGCWQHQQEQPAQSNQTAFQYLGHNSTAWFSHHALLQQLVHQPVLRICNLPHFLPKNILLLKLTIITSCFTKLKPWLAYKNKLQKHHSNIEWKAIFLNSEQDLAGPSYPDLHWSFPWSLCWFFFFSDIFSIPRTSQRNFPSQHWGNNHKVLPSRVFWLWAWGNGWLQGSHGFWKLHIWLHSSFDNKHEACARSNHRKLQHAKGRWVLQS